MIGSKTLVEVCWMLLKKDYAPFDCKYVGHSWSYLQTVSIYKYVNRIKAGTKRNETDKCWSRYRFIFKLGYVKRLFLYLVSTLSVQDNVGVLKINECCQPRYQGQILSLVTDNLQLLKSCVDFIEWDNLDGNVSV